ncbi:unnamed protein product, partial [Candidula unifasciata]
MVTEFMDLYVGSNKVSPTTRIEASSDHAMFSLPSLDSGVPSDALVESEFEMFRMNPFGWTANRVHGGLPVVRVNLARPDKKSSFKQTTEKETFRFSKPADVFLNYN